MIGTISITCARACERTEYTKGDISIAVFECWLLSFQELLCQTLEDGL